MCQMHCRHWTTAADAVDQVTREQEHDDDKVWYWFNGNQGGHATSSKYECFGAGGPLDTREAAAAASIENAEEACLEDWLEDAYAFPGTGRQPFWSGSADTIDYGAGPFGDCFIKVRFLTREKYMDRAGKGINNKFRINDCFGFACD